MKGDPSAIVSALYRWHNPSEGASADDMVALEAMVVVAYGGPAAEAWQLYMVIGTNVPESAALLDEWRRADRGAN